MLHKQKDIPAPAKTPFWKHLLTLQKHSKRLSTKHLSNIHTVKRVESSEPLATRQDVTQETLTESQTDRFRGFMLQYVTAETRSGYVNVRMRKWFILQKITAETLTEEQQSALNCNIFPSNVIDKTHIQALPTHFL